jgi:transcriptional regulator with XRE-family HTH domain
MKSNRRSVAVAFGRSLRDARKKIGVTQEQLAELADLDRTYPSLFGTRIADAHTYQDSN